MKEISQTQKQIYLFIARFIQIEGRPPTIREIGEARGISSTGHISHHLIALEKQGWITRERGSRGIKLNTPPGIPLRGTIAAGSPLEISVSPPHRLQLGAYPHCQNEDVYALLVKGDSMVEDAICDGDIVVIKPQATYPNGTIVVATHLLEGMNGSATLKRLFQEPERIRLQPANSKREPIFIKKQEWDREWSVQGKVIGLLRHWDLSSVGNGGSED